MVHRFCYYASKVYFAKFAKGWGVFKILFFLLPLLLFILLWFMGLWFLRTYVCLIEALVSQMSLGLGGELHVRMRVIRVIGWQVCCQCAGEFGDKTAGWS
jgi:hypothetical protein